MLATPALANTIYLVCPEAPYGDLTIDLTNSTVSMQVGGSTYPARINVTSIHWEHPERCADCTSSDPGTVTQTYDLDRATGILRVNDIFLMRNGPNRHGGPFTYPCTVGRAPTTKF
jgi:hypothetical protein